MIWRDELLDQLDFYWDNHLAPRLEGLTDDEYFWEPVSGCWTIRTAGDQPMIDWQWPLPEHPPLTTIAWRLAHIAIPVFGIRASAHFGDGSLTIATANWPATAEDGLNALREHYLAWRDGVQSLNDATLQQPVGEAEGPWAERPMATLVLHINREVMHHGGEIALLRDLYRARASEGRSNR
ncbi:DinB superfamily protein [Mycobacterium basiliense]|uniref:DinB superfamily protein n=1 Tax=Mycobacterium basiliense TaxID=2094119 RepID=A0A3S4CYF5_9MYCO|nr:DinB family protein [Mycobacterium basiliense]VDM90281.1 DinB superfamily protein [Mycobacterium basiliense]